MAKVTYRKPQAAVGSGRPSVEKKRVRDAETGKLVTVRAIKMDAATFGDNLTSVFRKNVAKARKENKELLGVADVIPANGK